MNRKTILSLSLFFSTLSLVCLLTACSGKKQEKVVAPWGEVVDGTDSVPADNVFSTGEIVENGEMIVVTMSGPDTYYDYHGNGLGTQYLLCEKFAQQLGVKVRVELCRDTTEMVRKVKDGDADLMMYMLPADFLRQNGLKPCGATTDSLKRAWSVADANADLATSLNKWFKPELLAEVRREERWMFSSRSVKRHVYAPYLNKAGGVISKYDNLFRRYSVTARWDWRLIAAQCYQESCFDANARSWAGACGLMQIMPSTADHLGLPRTELYKPERNIEAATRYIAELSTFFTDIPSMGERQNFVLAAYNGGVNHIKDAQALARKNGRDGRRWRDVAEYVLKLQQPQYYNDPVVRAGYMRGSETVEYVERIRQRYAQYSGTSYVPSATVPASSGGNGDDFGMTPRRAHHKNRFKL